MAKKTKKQESNLISPGDILRKEFEQNLLSSRLSVDIIRNRIISGDISIDYITGGGWPRGRLIELAAQEGAGKTSLAWRTFITNQTNTIHSVFNANKTKPLKFAYIDAEHALDYNYVLQQGAIINITTDDRKPDTQLAEMLGIKHKYFKQLKPEGVDIFLPNEGEEALNFIRRSLEMNYYDIIVVDSKDALVPAIEIKTADEKGYSKAPQSARQAEMFSRALRDMSRLFGKSKTCLIFISQLREKVGIVFGNAEVTSGGRALKYYASIRLYMTSGSQLRNADGDIIGKESTVKTVKNKTFAPFKKSTMFSINNIGIDIWRNAFNKGKDWGIITKTGNYYRYPANSEKGLIKENFIEELKKDSKLYEKLYNELLKVINDD